MNTAAHLDILDLQGHEVDQAMEGSQKRVSRWAAVCVGILVTGLVVLFLADRLFHPDKFLITEIVVHGDFNHVDGEQVREVVEASIDGNYFSVNLKRMETQITELPWVFSASLRRRWPSAIIVDVVEVQPVALWGESQWLNFTGHLVNMQALDTDTGYPGLPRLSGPAGSTRKVWRAFRNWSGKFASSGLTLNGLILEGSGLWFLDLSLGALVLSQGSSILSADSGLSGNVTMIVEGEQSTPSIQRFIRTLNQHLIAQFPDMQSVDLRYPNGFAIHWKNGERPVSLEKTGSEFGAGSDTGNSIE